MNLQGRLRPVREIGQRERAEMFALMNRHFTNLTRPMFDADLDEKRWVIQVLEPDTGHIRGFSTQTLIRQTFDGRPIMAVFSGDTIVEPHCWGRNVIAQVWTRFVFSLKDQNPGVELFWFLISNSFRTYRYLPVFFREFYPTYGEPTPDWAVRLIDQLAGARYPTAYDPMTGVVHGHFWSGCRPCEAIAEVPPGRMGDPHVEFFVERNAGYAAGDELCCIARIEAANAAPIARRMLNVPRHAEILPINRTQTCEVSYAPQRW